MTDLAILDVLKSAHEQNVIMRAQFAEAKKDITSFMQAINVLYPGVRLKALTDGSAASAPRMSWAISRTSDYTSCYLALSVDGVKDELAADVPAFGLPSCATLNLTVSNRYTEDTGHLWHMPEVYRLSEDGVFDAFKRDVAIFCGLVFGEAKPERVAALTPEQRDALNLASGKVYKIQPEIR